jgi:hypothetical protein
MLVQRQSYVVLQLHASSCTISSISSIYISRIATAASPSCRPNGYRAGSSTLQPACLLTPSRPPCQPPCGRCMRSTLPQHLTSAAAAAVGVAAGGAPC